MMNDEYGEVILRPHVKLEKNIDGSSIYALKFTEGVFSHIIFSYAKVQFIPDDVNDKLTAKFDYTVHEHKGDYDKKKFENELGDFLLELVIDGVIKNELIFSGGVDEQFDRNNDNPQINN